jgi:DNA-directed RNA polymerase specialized sigma24 family protein
MEAHYALLHTYTPANAPLGTALSSEFVRVLERVLATVPPEGREAFWQLYAGENVENIAQAQGKTPNAVRLALTRLRRRLRAGLQRCGWEQSVCEEMLATRLRSISEKNFVSEEKYPT